MAEDEIEDINQSLGDEPPFHLAIPLISWANPSQNGPANSADEVDPLGFRAFGVGTYESRGSFFEQVFLAAGWLDRSAEAMDTVLWGLANDSQRNGLVWTDRR